VVQLPAAVVLAVTAVGLVLSATGSWRTGPVVVAMALGLAAGMRLVLPTSAAGWLVVRGRSFDVAFLLGLAAALVVLAISIPAP